MYLLLIPVVVVGYMLWANASLTKKDKHFEIATRQLSYTPSPSGSSQTYGYTVQGKPTDAPFSPVPSPSLPAQVVQVNPTGEPNYIVVTATITPIPTNTPNPYGTLHATMTELWRLAYTATPYAATMYARPAWNMSTGDCLYNCYFVTATAHPLIYNP